ncbi:MAG: patatin-like phospholipase family protein [Candidatus Marinimicrobia bacterium]|nr:patatin-like phospholipase family protein [Candidatus Neomarinimicrobiota bacterium]
MSSVKIGLVLGSGSSRGWAHIGVIEALEKHGIEISLLTGVSAGSYIAASYAGGALESVKQFALGMDWKKVLSYLDLAFPRSGFIEGQRVVDLIQTYMDVTYFEEFRIPVHMLATDMLTGEQVVLSDGKITDALRASMAIPGLLTPKKINDRWLVDGGVVNPLPVDVCRAMGADFVIAVDLNSERINQDRMQENSQERERNLAGIEKKRIEVVKTWMKQYGSKGKAMSTKIDKWFSPQESSPHIFEVLGSSLNIMQKKIEETNLEHHPPDILIQPRLGDLKLFDFHHAERAITEGFLQGEQAIPEILEKLETFRQI